MNKLVHLYVLIDLDGLTTGSVRREIKILLSHYCFSCRIRTETEREREREKN